MICPSTITSLPKRMASPVTTPLTVTVCPKRYRSSSIISPALTVILSPVKTVAASTGRVKHASIISSMTAITATLLLFSLFTISSPVK